VKWWLGGLGVTVVVTFLNLIVILEVEGAWAALVPAIGFGCTMLFFGFTAGRQLLLKQMSREMEASTVTCVGGPMDGTVLPRPPIQADAVILQVAEHPEGTYRLDEDRLIWEED